LFLSIVSFPLQVVVVLRNFGRKMAGPATQHHPSCYQPGKMTKNKYIYIYLNHYKQLPLLLLLLQWSTALGAQRRRGEHTNAHERATSLVYHSLRASAQSRCWHRAQRTSRKNKYIQIVGEIILEGETGKKFCLVLTFEICCACTHCRYMVDK
jgi:hypothetical protein